MFDIVAFFRETVFRRPKLGKTLAGEEISEKRTTKMGNMLLICMFLAIMATAQWSLYTIREMPSKPTPVPSCVYSAVNDLSPEGTATLSQAYDSNWISNSRRYSYSGNSECYGPLISDNPKFDFTEDYDRLKGSATQVREMKTQISNLQNAINQNQNRKRVSKDDYSMAMTEKMANESQNGIYDVNDSRSRIKGADAQISAQQTNIDNINAQIATIRQLQSVPVAAARAKLQSAQEAYATAMNWYHLLIAVLSLAFSSIVFAAFYHFYVRLKSANSPYTIIVSVATFAYGLILLQVLLVFLWDIIPKSVMGFLINILTVFAPILYLVQFLWPILIVAIFGYAVFRIQKRLYSPANRLKRFLSSKSCPNCENAVDAGKPFCPICAHEIQIHCPHCHALTVKGMPHCSNCGGSLANPYVIDEKRLPFDDELKALLEKTDISQLDSVTFLSNDETSFTLKRASVLRLAACFVEKFGKSVFGPKELEKQYENVLAHMKSDLAKAEFDRLSGRIHSWIELGGSVEFKHKK